MKLRILYMFSCVCCPDSLVVPSLATSFRFLLNITFSARPPVITDENYTLHLSLFFSLALIPI